MRTKFKHCNYFKVGNEEDYNFIQNDVQTINIY